MSTQRAPALVSPVSTPLMLVAGALPLSIAAMNAALGLLAAGLAWELSRSPGARAAVLARWRSEPLLWALAAYVLAGVLSGLLGADPARSLPECRKDLHKLLSALAFSAAFALDSAPRLWIPFGAGFSLAGVVGIGQSLHAFLERTGGPLARAHGFVHPVTYGQMMGFASLGALSRLIAARAAPPGRPALAAFLALTTAALLLSQTRATVFAGAAGFAALCLAEAKARKWAGWFALALLGVLVAWELMPTGGRSLLAYLRGFDPASPHQVRFSLWSVAGRMFLDNPWTGVGPGQYGAQFTRYFEGTLDNQRVWASAHNLYLHQLAERGVVGGLALAGVFAGLLTRGREALWRARDARSLWALSAAAAFVLMNATETAFQGEQIKTMMLLIWAWGGAMRKTD